MGEAQLVVRAFQLGLEQGPHLRGQPLHGGGHPALRRGNQATASRLEVSLLDLQREQREHGGECAARGLCLDQVSTWG